MKLLMVYSDGFIKFYNCFMDKGEYKLTPKEWHIYSTLYVRWSPFLGATETTVTIISNVQTVFKDKSRPTRDKTNTWEQIRLLEVKGVIRLSHSNIENGKRFDYDQIIRVEFAEYESGFDKIHPKLYYKSDDPFELYFLCVIHRFKNKGFSQTFSGLAELLCCSESYVQKLVKSMKKKKLITYEQGKRYRMEDGQYGRKANTYYLYGELKDNVDDIAGDIEIVEDVTVKVENKDNYITIFGELALREILKRKEHSNWGKKEYRDGKEVNSNITEDDINILLTLEECGLEETFYNKFRGIVNSWIKNKSKNTENIEKWIENYSGKMSKIKDEWNKKKIEESIVNAIVIGEEVIVLSKDNVDQIDFSLADEIYYFDESEKLARGNFQYLAGSQGVTDKMRVDAIEEYKRNIKLGNKLTIKLIGEIREKIK